MSFVFDEDGKVFCHHAFASSRTWHSRWRFGKKTLRNLYTSAFPHTFMTILPTSNCLRYVYLILSVPDTSRFYQKWDLIMAAQRRILSRGNNSRENESYIHFSNECQGNKNKGTHKSLTCVHRTYERVMLYLGTWLISQSPQILISLFSTKS